MESRPKDSKVRHIPTFTLYNRERRPRVCPRGGVVSEEGQYIPLRAHSGKYLTRRFDRAIEVLRYDKLHLNLVSKTPEYVTLSRI